MKGVGDGDRRPMPFPHSGTGSELESEETRAICRATGLLLLLLVLLPSPCSSTMANNPSGSYPHDGARPARLTRVPSYLEFAQTAPRRAIASFENLVALANYEEHLRDARKMVWRDRGEPAVELYDLAECADHGVRGGLRASPASRVVSRCALC
jgi:hypothetical protein